MGRVSAVSLLARRFLLSKSADGFISLIAWVSVIGIALGVLALVVVTSVINGFESELTRVITGMNGEVLLYSREPVTDPATIETRIRKVLPEAESITHSFVAELMVLGPNGVAGAVVEGIDPTTLGEVTAIPKRVMSGRLPTDRPAPAADGKPSYEVALGTALADRIGAVEGTEVRLTLPFAGEDDEPDAGLSGGPRTVTAQVVGTVKMGMYEYDSKFVFAPLAQVQGFLGQPGRVTSFKLKLKRGSSSEQAAARLSDQFGYPFKAKDWAQLNKNLLYAIRLEKAVISVILTVIVIVAAFNVVSTLMMMIHDKTREIAILKAIGLMPSQAFRLFCMIGLGMGLVGTIIGIGFGIGMNWVIANFKIIDLPADIYYIGFLPVIARWQEIAVIGGMAVVISFGATLFPALKVARRKPLEGIRDE